MTHRYISRLELLERRRPPFGLRNANLLPLDIGEIGVDICAAACLSRRQAREHFELCMNATNDERAHALLAVGRARLETHFTDCEPPADLPALLEWSVRWEGRAWHWGPERLHPDAEVTP